MSCISRFIFGRRHGRPGIFFGCTWCWFFITLWRCMLAWLGAARLEPHLHRVRTWRTFQGKRILPTVWSKVQHGLEPWVGHTLLLRWFYAGTGSGRAEESQRLGAFRFHVNRIQSDAPKEASAACTCICYLSIFCFCSHF